MAIELSGVVSSRKTPNVSAIPRNAVWLSKRRAGQIPAAPLEHPQAGEKISAVHSGDVARASADPACRSCTS